MRHKRSIARRGGLTIATIWVGFTPFASAQPSLERAERLPEFGRSLAGVEDTTAFVLNPANLAFMRGGEFRWTGVFLNEANPVPYNGHALGLAFQIPFIDVVTGARLDFVYPPPRIGDSALARYTWLTWGLGLPMGPSAALGFSVQHSYSDGALADGFTGVSVGFTSRMTDWLAVSAVGHDLNRPENAFFEFQPSYAAGLALRPLSTRTVELAFEGKYLPDDDTWTPKALLGVDVASLGRLRSEFSVTDPTGGEPWSWQGALSLSLNVDTPMASTEFSGGVATGTTSGAANNYSPYFSVATRGFREPVGAQLGRYAINLRLETTPDAREHFTLLRDLWSLAKESTVDAVALTLRATPGESSAAVEELRDALFELRRAGKRVVCHVDSMSLSGLYLCSAANRIVLTPSGDVRVAGLSAQQVYVAELLKHLGVRADFVRAGQYKSAPEQFSERQSTAPSRANRIDLMQQLEIELTTGLSLGRNLTPNDVRERVGHGPFLASEALQLGFVDAVAFEDELDDQVRIATGRETRLTDDNRVPKTRATWGRDGAIAVVYVDGEIIDGHNADFSILGVHATGSDTISDTLESLRKNPRIKGIVVRVDSPGGSSSASDAMWRAVSLTAKSKPTVVSMGGVAASGGYYLSAAAARIFANPTTITGSIGVFYGKADISGLLGRLGVDVQTYKTHPSADAESWFRPFTEAERAAMSKQINVLYQLFLSRVAEGRQMSTEQVDTIAQGRVWTGRQAQARHLVDEVGGFRQALEYVRKQAHLSDDAAIVELPPRDSSLLKRALGLAQVGDWERLTISQQVKSVLRELAPLAIHPGDKAQSRLEIQVPDLR